LIQIVDAGFFAEMSTIVKMSKEHKDQFSDLNKQQKDQFISELKLELSRIGIGYENLDNNLFKGIILSTPVSRDTNKMDFFQTFFFIRSKRDFLIVLIKTKLYQFDEINS